MTCIYTIMGQFCVAAVHMQYRIASSYLFHLQVYRSGAAQGSPTLYAYMHALYLHAGFWEIV